MREREAVRQNPLNPCTAQHRGVRTFFRKAKFDRVKAHTGSRSAIPFDILTVSSGQHSPGLSLAVWNRNTPLRRVSCFLSLFSFFVFLFVKTFSHFSHSCIETHRNSVRLAYIVRQKRRRSQHIETQRDTS